MKKKKLQIPSGDEKDSRENSIARRQFLGRTTCLFVAAGLASGSLQKAKAADKYSKEDVSYQDTPKGDQSCANCKFWDGEGGCEIVEGEVAAEGWCAVWVAS